ncbi:hypothetical protein AB4Z48_39630 [Cupriavidus sp. 2TAF22]|uniref:hypothetical protein n=1 Tax=unclassified Cupriavidus TaxID=2640874 RepID=UPI003F8EFF7C
MLATSVADCACADAIIVLLANDAQILDATLGAWARSEAAFASLHNQHRAAFRLCAGEQW